MTKKSDTVNCTNIEWIGRAHCENCHIRQMMLFSDLPEHAFQDSLHPIDNYLYPPGSTIYEAGTETQYIYSIRRGMVKLVHVTEGGSNRIVRLLGSGTAIGLELLDGADSFHHTAIAVSQVDLCKIPVTTVKHLENKHPELIRKVGQRLQAQLNIADQWIIALATGTARQRVAQLVLMLNKHYTDENGSFILLSREDMAAMTGIAVETVSRMIAEFKRLKLLYRTVENRYSCDVPSLVGITQST
jgi:CRP-like cAMP-binding protein